MLSLILTVNENLSQELKILFKGLNFCGDRYLKNKFVSVQY